MCDYVIDYEGNPVEGVDFYICRSPAKDSSIIITDTAYTTVLESEDSEDDSSKGKLVVSPKPVNCKPKYATKKPVEFNTKTSQQLSLGNWEKNTKGFGSKMLTKMGYNPETSTAMKNPIEVNVKLGRKGIGFDNIKTQPIQKQNRFYRTNTSEIPLKRVSPEQAYKTQPNKKNKQKDDTDYKKIIQKDYLSKGLSLYSNFDNIYNSDVFDKYLADDDDLSDCENNEQVTTVISKEELSDEMKYFLKDFESRMENCDHTNLENFFPALENACQKFSKSSLVAKIISEKLLSISVSQWHPIHEMFEIVELFTDCQDLLDMNVYQDVFSKTWLPIVKKYLNEEWRVEEPTKLIQFIDGWRPQIPEDVTVELLKDISGKLSEFLTTWNPSIEISSPDIYLRPWLRLLEDYFHTINTVVISKLSHNLKIWNAIDKSAHNILSLWKDILSDADLDDIFYKFIQPKLIKLLKDTSFALTSTEHVHLEVIMIWISLFGVRPIEIIVTEHFFPRFTEELRSMLVEVDNFQQTGRWYKQWMNEFPDIMKTSSHIKSEIQKLLQMMVKTKQGSNLLKQKHIDLNITAASIDGYSNRERLEMVAQDKGIAFYPKIGVNSCHQNRQIYHFGNFELVYFDREATFIFENGVWNPITLKKLVKRVL